MNGLSAPEVAAKLSLNRVAALFLRISATGFPNLPPSALVHSQPRALQSSCHSATCVMHLPKSYIMKRSLLVLVTLLLAGCVAPPAQSLTEMSQVTPLTRLSPIPVVCPPDIEQRVEETHAMGITMKYETGKVFAKAFNGTRTDQPYIELVDSNLSAAIADLGFTGVFSYKVAMKLHCTSGVFELKAEHTRKVHGFELPTTSVKITVETVVADLRQQVEKHLKSD